MFKQLSYNNNNNLLISIAQKYDCCYALHIIEIPIQIVDAQLEID